MCKKAEIILATAATRGRRTREMLQIKTSEDNETFVHGKGNKGAVKLVRFDVVGCLRLFNGLQVFC